jgi:hypothetical protein
MRGTMPPKDVGKQKKPDGYQATGRIKLSGYVTRTRLQNDYAREWLPFI